jgi:cysteine desulfurase/selenocysteine lyase
MTSAAVTGAVLDVARVRADFPILRREVYGKPLVYLDNAATTQKPQAVIDAVVSSYAVDAANVHRGVHQLSERATEAYEGARARIQQHLHAAAPHEIVFVRGATEGINLVASSFGRAFVQAGDEIVISAIEHHSNIVPWQMLCEQTGAILRVVPIDDRGDLVMADYARLLGPRTKLVAITQISNALGTVTPIHEIIGLAHRLDIPVLVDGAQAVPHQHVDVEALDCDFYVFSGHKVFGPTGIGVLYAKERWLDRMPPYQGGGDMIKAVSFDKTVYNELPYKFEAGTPHIAGAIGLAAGLQYIAALGLDRITDYEHDLLAYGSGLLSAIDGVRLIGTARHKSGVLSFVLDGVHPHDLGTILDHQGVAIRAGHHCAMPVMERFGVPATARASLAFYNTREELDTLAAAIQEAREIFR